MNLKNYTTNVSVDKSIMQIEKILSQFGATHIMKEYLTDGTVKSIAFRLNNKGYQIPANIEGVKRSLWEKKQFTQRQDEQARRVAWRIIKDWIHAQLSIIVSGQAEPEQVLLPYLWDGKKTLYQAYKSGQLQLECMDKEND